MKSIVILGGTGGLGSQLAKKLEGDYGVIPLGSKLLDIRDYQKCKDFFDNNIVDIVINLAGVNHDRMVHKLGKEDQYLINHLLDVNIHGAVNIASVCLPAMRERGYGRIIFTSSILATKEVPGTALYSSCKAFLDRFIKGISIENISKGVTANSIQLGYFDGGLTYKLPDKENYRQQIPLKRWGTIEELESTVRYIINTEYLTGANIPINGGV